MVPGLVSRRKRLGVAKWDMPGGRRRHRMGRHCGCRGRGLLALGIVSLTVSHDQRAVDWHEVLTSLEAGDGSGYLNTSGKKDR